jgi:hypothetical protein
MEHPVANASANLSDSGRATASSSASREYRTGHAAVDEAVTPASARPKLCRDAAPARRGRITIWRLPAGEGYSSAFAGSPTMNSRVSGPTEFNKSRMNLS